MRSSLTATLTAMGAALVTVAAAAPALAEQDVIVHVKTTASAQASKTSVPVEFTTRLISMGDFTPRGWQDDIRNWGGCPRELRTYTLATPSRMELCRFTLASPSDEGKVNTGAMLPVTGSYLHPNGEKESFEGRVYFDRTSYDFAAWGDGLPVTRQGSSDPADVVIAIEAPTSRPMPRLQTLLASQPCTITGTPRDDFLLGTPGDDVICGLDGDDVVVGFGGNDILVGGDGDDILHGGSGDDLIYGGSGDDRADGGAGDDQMVGGLGEDLLIGGGGDDTLRGDSGDDALLADTEQTEVVQDGGNWMTTDGGANILEDHDGEPAAWMAPADRQLPKDRFEPTRGCVFSIARPYDGGGYDCLDNAYNPVGGSTHIG